MMHQFQQQQQALVNKHVKVFVYEWAEGSSVQVLKTAQPTRVHRLFSAQPFSLEELIKLLHERNVPVPQEGSEEKVELFFKDEDDEWVSLINEQDWSVAWSLTEGHVLKVAVVSSKKKPAVESQECPRFRGCRRGAFGGHPFGRQGGCPFQGMGGGFPGFGRCGAMGGGAGFENIIENVLGNLFPKEGNQGSSSPNATQEPSTQEQQQQPEFNFDELRNKFGGIIDLVKNNIDNVELPHFGVVCDGCNTRNFTGKRWKCNDCEDFDLCGTCFEKYANQHAEGFHTFQEVAPRAQNFVKNLIQNIEQGSGQHQQQTSSASQESAATNTQPSTQEASAPQQEEPKVAYVLDQDLYSSEPVVEQSTVQNVFVPPEENQHEIKTTEASPFQDKLKLLKDMGFHNEQQCLQLLIKHKGDIQRVVAEILNASIY